MSLLERIDSMRFTLGMLRIDADKADQGVNAAETRVRKAMQEIKAQAQEVREAINAQRAARS